MFLVKQIGACSREPATSKIAVEATANPRHMYPYDAVEEADWGVSVSVALVLAGREVQRCMLVPEDRQASKEGHKCDDRDSENGDGKSTDDAHGRSSI